MANMSYCRFENTSKDMQDCWNALAEVDNIQEWFENLSEYEQRGVKLVMEMSRMFVEELGPELESAGVEV